MSNRGTRAPSLRPAPAPSRTSSVPHQPRPKSGEERIDYRLVALTRMVESPGYKSAFLWRLDTVSLGKHQRNGVEWQGRPSTTSQRIGAHAQSHRQGSTSFARLRVRRSLGQKPLPPTARSTPFLCSCAKERGGAPKKRAFGCRHGTCTVPPASPTDSKPQHPRQLRQADLSAR